MALRYSLICTPPTEPAGEKRSLNIGKKHILNYENNSTALPRILIGDVNTRWHARLKGEEERPGRFVFGPW